MSCDQCGARTTRRGICEPCARMDILEELEIEDGRNRPECPECGGDTSGRGIVCYRCRGEEVVAE